MENVDKYALSDTSILKQIGIQLKRSRIEAHITQSELGKKAGVSMFSVSSVENGNNTSLLTLIQILRALNRLDFLDTFFQERQISPIAYAKLMDKRKISKRVVKTKNNNKETTDEW
jgi:DNA-binding XRE family transcriptional regulator